MLLAAIMVGGLLMQNSQNTVELAIDVFDNATGTDIQEWWGNRTLLKEVFLPLQLDYVDSGRFDSEWEINLRHGDVYVSLLSDPYCEVWKESAEVNERFGQWGYYKFSFTSEDRNALNKVVGQIRERFGGVLV